MFLHFFKSACQKRIRQQSKIGCQFCSFLGRNGIRIYWDVQAKLLFNGQTKCHIGPDCVQPGNTEHLLCKCPLHLEHPKCSMGLKMEKIGKLTVSPNTTTAFNTAKCRNLNDPEQTAIKDDLLVCCTPSPTNPLKLPQGTYGVTAKKYSVSLTVQ